MAMTIGMKNAVMTICDSVAENLLRIKAAMISPAKATISQGMRAIVDTMQTHDVERLVVAMGAGVSDPQDDPGLLDRIINLLLKLTARHVYEDMKRVADIVRNSDRAWTLVRAPMLTNDPGTGDVRVGYLGGDIGTRLSREDMAMFMVRQLEDETYIHKAPVISN